MEQGQPTTVIGTAQDAAPHWKPVNGSHAIQMAYAAVSFSQPVTSVIWKRILATSRDVAFNAGLTLEVPVQSLMFQIGGPPGQKPPPPSPFTNSGVEFHRQEIPGMVNEKLVLAENQIRFETYAYTRWAGFSAAVEALFEAVLPIYFEAVNLSSIALEYTDVFVWSEEGAADCSEILNLESPFIAFGAAQRSGLWHSHTGWFDFETLGQRILANADVTVADAATPEGTRRVINIRTHESSQFLASGDGSLIDLDVGQKSIVPILNKHHDTLKIRLHDMLTESGRDLISLGSPDA
ncbi:MAG: TIGR04255 family protein [Sphingomonadaceae bacterium]|nr:TIGR04255 family protein [Sphingomonadaceae bacterium]